MQPLTELTGPQHDRLGMVLGIRLSLFAKKGPLRLYEKRFEIAV